MFSYRWLTRLCLRFQSTCPARGTTIPVCQSLLILLFQSTCPARGTTALCPIRFIRQSHFNPRPPRGARQPTCGQQLTWRDFNPRAPRGARHLRRSRPRHRHRFQSTCPARGTTAAVRISGEFAEISIHVPREGHDSKHAQFLRANLRKSYNYPFERDALHAKNACKLINASS